MGLSNRFESVTHMLPTLIFPDGMEELGEFGWGYDHLNHLVLGCSGKPKPPLYRLHAVDLR